LLGFRHEVGRRLPPRRAFYSSEEITFLRCSPRKA
jgi:hypothetical protein